METPKHIVGVQHGWNLMSVNYQAESDISLDEVHYAPLSYGENSLNLLGDVTGKLLLAHVASAQGMVAAETIAGNPTVGLNYRMMPRATYCHPEVASFGYTEAEARDAGYEVKSASFNFRANGKALGLGDYDGWAKIVSDAQHGEILGAHLIGPQVTEMLPELTLAQNLELTGEEIARNVHAHPTLSEVLMEAAHGLAGEMIHA